MTADWSCPDGELVLSVEKAQDHDLWLTTRRNGIGGSDAAALMGESRYGTEFDVWMDKTGRSHGVDQSLAMEMGSRWEQGVADKFCEDSGLTVRRRGLMRSKAHPRLLANVDRLVDDGSGLECKTANQFTKVPLPEDDEVYLGLLPDWFWQVVSYLLVTGRKGWYVAVAIGNTGWVTRYISRDEPRVQEAMAQLVDKVEPWWQHHVIDDVIPPMAEIPPMDQVELKDKFEFLIPEIGLELRDDLRNTRQAIADLKEHADELKDKLKAESGGARWLLADGQPILEFNPRSGRKTFEKKRFFAQQPVSGTEVFEWLKDHEGFEEQDDDGLLELINQYALTEADYTKTGDPSTSLLIVGQKEDQ